MANFVSYANATELMTAIGQKLSALNGAYVVKGNSAFDDIPSTLTASMNGFVYNITDDFTTDARFVEGAGKDYPAGTNVAIVNLGNAETPDMKFDVIGSFIDVDAIMDAITAVSDMIASEFDATENYAVGDICVKDLVLYKFTATHSAGAWDENDVVAVTVDDLLDILQTNINTVSTNLVSVREMISDDNFDTSTAYSTGDIVVYDNGLYKFKADHAAGAWDSAEVDEVTVLDIIQAAEPDALTSEQVNTLIGLLG